MKVVDPRHDLVRSLDDVKILQNPKSAILRTPSLNSMFCSFKLIVILNYLLSMDDVELMHRSKSRK
jgi:hypothetical protein